MADTKEHAHELIEQLAPGQLSAVVGLLEVMIDPLAGSIANAGVEDEEILPETAAELDAAHAPGARAFRTKRFSVSSARTPLMPGKNVVWSRGAQAQVAAIDRETALGIPACH
jgi:hypothetical protein